MPEFLDLKTIFWHALGCNPKEEIIASLVNSQVNSQELNSQELNSQELNSQELNSQELNSQELNSQEIRKNGSCEPFLANPILTRRLRCGKQDRSDCQL